MESEEPRSAQADHLQRAVAALASLASPEKLTLRISKLESDLASLTREQAADWLVDERVDSSLLHAALTVKRLAGRINDIVHAVGILTALPYVLEPGEVIASLSLAAGNTGRAYDLETDRQIAEFKFIAWRGGAEAGRQNVLFIDLFRLASADIAKRRVVYVVGKQVSPPVRNWPPSISLKWTPPRSPLRFLNGHRALKSVLSRNASAARTFQQHHNSSFLTVGEYYATVSDLVEIVDLADRSGASSARLVRAVTPDAQRWLSTSLPPRGSG